MVHGGTPRHLTYANVMSTLAVVLVIGGGAAYAANTVFSTDIVDGQVKIADIGQGAVATSEVLNDTASGGGLAAADLRSGSVGTAEVADQSLKGADLGVRVRSEKQVDDGSPAAVCGTTTDFEECVTVFFTVPRPQRLLLVGSGEFQGATGVNAGECSFSVGNLADLGLRTFSGDGDTATGPNIAMNSVTGVLAQGAYEIAIDCREIQGNLQVSNTELSVAALGDG